jgi:hypothetical protein
MVPLQLSPVIVGITNIDELLSVPKGQATDVDLSGTANSDNDVFTVPAGKRWKLRYVALAASIANSTLYVKTGGVRVYISPSTTTRKEPFDKIAGPIVLDQGDVVGTSNTGDIGDTAVSMYILYEEEDRF